MKNSLLKFIGILIIGAVGGIFSTQILWPYFVEKPLFYKYQLEQPPVIEREEIIVQENTALTQAVEKVEKSVVGIGSATATQKFLRGSGLILTNDGLVLTLASLVATDAVIFYDDEIIPAKIVKKDFQNNLALLKIEKGNLPSCRFADLEKTKIGERVFLVGEKYNVNTDTFVNFTNEGIIKNFDESLVETNISEGKFAPGTTLFNISGEVVGLDYLSAEGKIVAIPVFQIKQFTGF
jgi:S1-C subfamily serine protease